MAIKLPEQASEIDQRMKVDVARELATSNPFLRNSWLGAIITSIANRIFDFYFALSEAQKEAIPDTASLHLDRWAALWRITRKSASKSSGNVCFTGTASTVIDAGVLLFASDNKRYQTQLAATIVVNPLVQSGGITRVGSVATFHTAGPHGLSSNFLVTVTGAAESEYNITDKQITVTAEDAFEYPVGGTPTSPDTGTATATLSSAYVSIPVQSIEAGEDQNQLLDTPLSLQVPISGADDDHWVDFGTLGNGTDEELTEDYRLRLLDRIQNPIAHFNVAEIIAVAKEIDGVTRVWVDENTKATSATVGACDVYFVRDNDSSGLLPSGAEVAIVETVIHALVPANTDTDDVSVQAPTSVSTSYIFDALSPDTSTMRSAVIASLEQFFAEQTEVGDSVVKEAVNATIFQSVDLTTGEALISFTLNPIAADITITAGELATLGNITFII